MKPRSNNRVISSFGQYVKWSTRIAIGISLLVLIGWIFDITVIKNIIPHAATMKFNTALGFLCGSMSLWFLQKEEGQPGEKRLGQTLGALTLLIGLLSLSEYIFSWDLGIDQFFVRDLGTASDAFPGRMSLITAVCFSLYGLALLLIESKPSQYFSTSLTTLSLLAITGYLFDYRSLYRLAGFGSVALHTALTFFILSLATLAARPMFGMMKVVTSDQDGGRAIRRLLPFSTFIIILLGWLVNQGEQLGLFSHENDVVILVVVVVLIYSPLIYLYANRINQKEDALRISEQKFSILFDKAAFSASLSKLPEGVIIDVNEAFEKTFGYTKQEAIGKTTLELGINPDAEGRARVLNALKEGMGSAQDLELALRTKSGELRIFMVNINLVDIAGQNHILNMTQDITERKQAEEELKYVSLHDALTGLFNRRLFEEEMSRLEQGRDFPISILMADVDQLKEMNDQHGHDAGDKLLKRAGQLLLAAFRIEDVVARIGGDEFAVLLPATDQTMAEMLLQRTRQLIEDHNTSYPETPVSLSFGVSTAMKPMHLFDTLKEADANLYQDKQKHK